MGNELAVRHIPDLPLAELGKILAGSGFFADSKQASQAVVKILAGREIGIGPITSMTGIYIVKGKVSLSANLMAGCIKRSGHYTYEVVSLTDEECELRFVDGKKEIGRSKFTMAEARRAEIANGDNWRKYPKNMLFARAISNGAKWYCPELFGGPVYTPDELGQIVDESGELTVDYEAKQAKAAEVQAVIDAARSAPATTSDGGNGATAASVHEVKFQPAAPVATTVSSAITADTTTTADASTKCTPGQRTDIIAAAKAASLTAEELKARLAAKGVAKLADLSFDNANRLLARLQQLKTEKEAADRF